MPGTVLIADNDPALVQRVKAALERKGGSVLTAYSGSEVMAQASKTGIDLLILGSALPDCDGLELIASLRKRQGVVVRAVILLASDLDEASCLRAWDLGVDSFQSKRESALPRLIPEVIVKVERIFKSLDESSS